MEFRDRCIYCGNAKVYLLKDLRLKCAKCKKRFSLKKIDKELEIIEAFCTHKSINTLAKETNISYATLVKKFKNYRKNLAIYLEKEFLKNVDKISEYDEYIYIENSKKKDQESIFDAFNFITFNYGKVYNLLMPPLQKYKNDYTNKELTRVKYEEFKRFLKYNRVSNIKSNENSISKFWIFFEDFMKKYRGIKRDNFFYYLKEAEFKFNYNYKERVTILKSIKIM